MVPAFGEFACGVEPVHRLFLARPAHWKHGWTERVERLMVFRAFFRCGFHPRNQIVPSQPAVLADTFRVEEIDQRYEFRGRNLLGIFRLVAVPLLVCELACRTDA